MAVNFAVAAAKLVTALFTGSSAMLAESFHAIADTGNEGVLLIAQSRSEVPPDERHPLGHGREAYFWALLASLGVKELLRTTESKLKQWSPYIARVFLMPSQL